MPPEQQLLAEEDEKTLLTTGQPTSRYVTDAATQGSRRSMQLINFGIHDAAGKLQSIGTVGVDVAELFNRRAEAEALQTQLIQAGKMEAIGQLAGGVAHDFNNLLGAIIGFAGFLTEDLSDRPDLQNHAQRILKICDRAKSLVRQILSFASADRLDRQLIDVRAVIAETRDLLRPTLPPTTELLYDLGDDRSVGLVANEGQISRLIVNLCVNASDAMAGKRGRISIGFDVVEMTQEHLAEFFSADQSRVFSARPPLGESYIRIEIRDNGSGMDPDTLKRMMEPFFTTKGRKEGTGLGLWIVDGIVHAYRGCYVVDSELGIGTRFSIYLPYDRHAEVLDLVKAIPSPLKSVLRGNERILVVDDQQDILDVFLIGLERIGFEVATMNDPAEALELFKEQPHLWDVVITDQVMPGMRGTELLKKMRKIRPDLRTVLCTGFAELATDEPLSLESVDVSLMKPIQPTVLAGHIRDLVDSVPANVTRH
jgi:signal transduction histidine kinase